MNLVFSRLQKIWEHCSPTFQFETLKLSKNGESPINKYQMALNISKMYFALKILFDFWIYSDCKFRVRIDSTVK